MTVTTEHAKVLKSGPAAERPLATDGRYWYFADDTFVLSKSDGSVWRDIADLSGAGGAVSSVFTRTGAVTAASGDYTASQVTNVAAGAIAATDVQAALNELDTEKLGTGATAAAASVLSPGRNIDGQAFTGTADITVIAPGTHAATSKTTPVDADELPLADSAASFVLKKLTWANLKATLKTYFDTLYAPVSGGVSSIAKSGSTGLTGAVTLTGGTNVTLTQAGQDISIAASASAAAELLAFFQQTAGTSQSTTSATQADVDATNAAVTFVAPASGNVIVRVTAAVRILAANQNAFFGLREATTNIAGPTFVIQGQTATQLEQVVTYVAYLSGISAGSHTYKLAYSVNGGTTFTVRQIGSASTIHPVTIEVWAA